MRLKLASIIGFILACGSSLVLAAATEITLVSEDWMPISGKAGDSKPGYMIELAKKILEPAGYTVNYKNVPWAQAVRSTRQGQYNCVVGAQNSDTPDFIFTKEPFAVTTTSFFVKKGNSWRYNNEVNSLDTMRVGLVGGNTYNSEMTTYLNANTKGNVEVLDSDNALEQNILNLLADKIDVVIQNKMVMEYQLRKMNALDKVELAGLSSQDSLYIACSPDAKMQTVSGTITNALSDGIVKMRQDGGLKTVLDTYGLQDWK